MLYLFLLSDKSLGPKVLYLLWSQFGCLAWYLLLDCTCNTDNVYVSQIHNNKANFYVTNTK